MATANFTQVNDGGTYTASAGSDRILVICLTRSLASGGSAGQPSVSTLSLGASTLANGRIVQAVVSRKDAAAERHATYIWYIKEADIETGAQTLAATWGQTMGGTTNRFACYTLTNRDQTTPIDTTATAVFDSVVTDWPISATVAAGSDAILAAGNVTINSNHTQSTGWTEDGEYADTDYESIYAHYDNVAAGTLTGDQTVSATRQGAMALAAFAAAANFPAFQYQSRLNPLLRM